MFLPTPLTNMRGFHPAAQSNFRLWSKKKEQVSGGETTLPFSSSSSLLSFLELSDAKVYEP